jgi:hypothetical protein
MSGLGEYWLRFVLVGGVVLMFFASGFSFAMSVAFAEYQVNFLSVLYLLYMVGFSIWGYLYLAAVVSYARRTR